MKRALVIILWVAVGMMAVSSATAARRPDPNAPKNATNLPNLSNPFRGTVENVTANNVVVVGEKGPTGTFVIQAGTRITRDGKTILAAQIFKGDAIQVSFDLVKTTGLMTAREIFVGTLPAPKADPPGSDTPTKKQKKSQ